MRAPPLTKAVHPATRSGVVAHTGRALVYRARGRIGHAVARSRVACCDEGGAAQPNACRPAGAGSTAIGMWLPHPGLVPGRR